MRNDFLSLKEKIFSKEISSNWAVPIVLFGISFIAFGLLIPKLGFYMDDWHFVHYSYTRGVESLNEVLFYDSRPFAGWLYILGFRLMGYKATVWHIADLILRAMTATSFWLLFKTLWKKEGAIGFYIALLFLIYPSFLLQPMSVAYSIHWLGFFLYALSLFLMLVAFQQDGKSVFIVIAIALIAEGVHLFTSEYFSGLELLRPFILWVLISRRKKSMTQKLKVFFLHWLPYLLVLTGYFYWRVILFEGPPRGDRNVPILLYRFLEEPLGASFSLLITALEDASVIFFGSWFQALEPEVFNLSSLFTSFVFVLMISCFFILYTTLNRFVLDNSNGDISKEEKSWRKEGLLLGSIALFSGTLPIWIIDKAISTHTNQMAATRFSLPSMLGAAILLVILIDFFISERKKANLVISVLIALAIGVHLHNAHLYEYSWEKQKNLYHQLVQRIPALEPNTAIVSEAEILLFMGEYPASYAINTLYFPVDDLNKEETPYWFFAGYAGYYDRINLFLEGAPLEKEHLLSSFSGNSNDNLTISFEPEKGQCLWVLRPEDTDLRLISERERIASLNSSVDRILIENEKTPLLPPEIFGEESPQNWCSYYQKADLVSV